MDNKIPYNLQLCPKRLELYIKKIMSEEERFLKELERLYRSFNGVLFVEMNGDITFARNAKEDINVPVDIYGIKKRQKEMHD